MSWRRRGLVWLGWSFASLLGLVLLLLALIAYVLATESGTRLWLRLVSAALPGLQIEQVQGKILGDLALSRIRLHQNDIELQLERLDLDCGWQSRQLYCQLQLTGLDSRLQPSPATAFAWPELSLPDVRFLPIPVRLDLKLHDSHWQQQALPEVALELVLFEGEAELQRLQVQDSARDLDLDLRGRLNPNGDYRLDLAGTVRYQQLNWNWLLRGPLHDVRFEVHSVEQPERWPSLVLAVKHLLKSTPHAEGQLSWLELPPAWQPSELPELSGRLHLKLLGDQLDWTYKGRVRVDAPPAHGSADLNLYGQLQLPLVAELKAKLSAEAKGRWRLDTAGKTGRDQAWSIGLRANADAKQASLTELTLDLPQTQLTAQGQVWPELNLNARWDASKLAALWPDLQGSTQGQLRLAGPYQAPAFKSQLEVKQFRWQQAYRLDELRLKAQGELAAKAPLELDLRVRNLEAGLLLRKLDAELNGTTDAHRLTLSAEAADQQQLALTLTGGWSTVKQRWQGLLNSVQGQWPGQGQFQQPQAAELSWSTQDARLKDWCLVADDERLCLSGQWQAASGWQGALTTQGLALRRVRPWLPASIPQIAGLLDLDAKAQGVQLPTELSASLRIRDNALPAELPLTADIGLDWRANQLKLAPSWLELAGNRLSAAGHWRDKPELSGRLDAKRLDRLKFDVSGSLVADWQIRGTAANPRLISDLQADSLSWQQWGVKSLSLKTDIAETGAWSLQLASQKLQLPGQELPSLALTLQGTDQQHRLRAEIEAPPRLGKAELQLDGRWQMAKQQWTGALSQLRLAGAWGDWQSLNAAALSLSPSQQRLAPLCLQQQEQKFCLQAEQRQNKLVSSVQLEHFPLSWFSLLLPDLRWTGQLSGNADLNASLAPFGLNQAKVDLQLGPASLALPETFGDPPLVQLDSARLQAELRNKSWQLNSRLELPQQQYLDAQARLSNLALGLPQDSSQLDARLAWHLTDWSALTLVVPEIQSAQGTLDGQFSASGRFAAPRLRGQLTLKDGQFVIPELGTETRAQLQIKTDDGERLDFSGELAAGDKGKLALNGDLGLSANWPLQLSLKGTDYLLLDRPEIRLFADPDLRILHNETQAKALQIQGTVAVGPSLVWLEELPESKVVTSTDVAVIDRPQTDTQGSSLPILMDLALTLKQPFEFNGQGLTGKIKGGLTLKQTPGKSLRALGELQIDQGKYDAYGQKLDLKRARLAFNGPVDNPALDLEASRNIEKVRVGLQGKGTAQNPQISLFSEPPMDESEILSWLILGRPLDKASADEGNQLANAALALGVKGAGAITAQIASRLGLEKVSLEVAGTGSDKEVRLTAGLTKNLSLSYGQAVEADSKTGERSGGVFRLRYQLTPSLAVELIGGAITGAELAFEREFESFSSPSQPTQKALKLQQQVKEPDNKKPANPVTPQPTQLAPGTAEP